MTFENATHYYIFHLSECTVQKCESSDTRQYIRHPTEYRTEAEAWAALIKRCENAVEDGIDKLTLLSATLELARRNRADAEDGVEKDGL